MAKRISKVAAVRTKFAESTTALSDIQTRLFGDFDIDVFIRNHFLVSSMIFMLTACGALS